MSIDMLSDDVLLEVFDFYVDQTWRGDGDEYHSLYDSEHGWQPLVHVCRRWRSVVFGSPHRLNLRLVCTANTRARDTVDIWPALPLLIRVYDPIGRVDNIVDFLKHSDIVRRISQISLQYFASLPLQVVLEAMQVPFPALTDLLLRQYGQTEPVLPLSGSFLGGSAPRLRSLQLHRTPYPGLPKLLLSATHLTRLHLDGIPDSGYIPPEVMAACLFTLTSLEQLFLEFRFPRPLPDQQSQRLPPSIRTSLPGLNDFRFKGGAEYLEVLVARINAPRLKGLHIIFFNDVVFTTPQFTRFIGHTPTLGAFNEATVFLWYTTASITLSSAHARLNVSIYCRELDWQLSFLEQVCTSSLLPLLTLQDLYMMSESPWPQDWKDIIDYAQWLELLHSFSAVKNLYLSKELTPCVVPALQDLIGGRITEAFPTLENIFLEELQESGPVQEGIGKFVAARQVTSHPITLSRWDRSGTRF